MQVLFQNDRRDVHFCAVYLWEITPSFIANQLHFICIGNQSLTFSIFSNERQRHLYLCQYSNKRSLRGDSRHFQTRGVYRRAVSINLYGIYREYLKGVFLRRWGVNWATFGNPMLTFPQTHNNYTDILLQKKQAPTKKPTELIALAPFKAKFALL